MNVVLIVQLSQNLIQGGQQYEFDMLTVPMISLDDANKIIHVYIPGFDGNRLGRLVTKGMKRQGKRIRSGKCGQYIFFLLYICLGQGIQSVREAGVLRAELAVCQVCNHFGRRCEQGGGCFNPIGKTKGRRIKCSSPSSVGNMISSFGTSSEQMAMR
jgi:hypothetical protein